MAGEVPIHLDLASMAYLLGVDVSVLRVIVAQGMAPRPTFRTPERFSQDGEFVQESISRWSMRTVPAWLRALDALGMVAENVGPLPSRPIVEQDVA